MAAPGPDKKLCGAQLPNQPEGRTCKLTAGARTDHLGVGRCSRHGGNTRNHKTAAKTEMVLQEVARLGLKIETTPAEALLDEIYRTAANVEFFESLVVELPTHPEPDQYVEHVNDETGEPTGGGHWERGEPGIYGRTYHQSGVPTGEAKPHVLMVMFDNERKHLTKITVEAMRVGIAEEMVSVARNQAESIARVCREFAVALGHDPSSPEVREAFRVQLTLLSGGRAA